MAIGQSIGTLAAIVITFGWNLTGPVEIARADLGEARRIYYESLISRGMMLPPLLVAIWAIGSLTAPPGHIGLTLAVAMANALGGYSFAWVAIGLGRASILVFYDAFPRLTLSLVTVAVLKAGGSLYWYPALIALGIAVGIVLFSTLVLRPRRTTESMSAILRRRVKGQASAAATAMLGSVYGTAAILFVSIATTVDQTALASSADRLYKMALLAVVALSNALQAWVVAETPSVARLRRSRALGALTGLGILGMTGLSVLGPKMCELLFGRDLAPAYPVMVGYGLAFAFIAPGTSLAQHWLIPAGGARGVLKATAVGVCVGIPALLGFAHLYGAGGAAAGLAISELIVLCTLGAQARRVVG